jgi:hypothetical protein
MPQITVAAATAGLNQHAVQKSPVIQQKLRQGLEWEAPGSMITPRACDNTYSAPNAVATELLQAYQYQFTPKGSVELDAQEYKLQKIKVDIVITGEDLESLWDTYMVEWHEIGKDPIEWSFYRYVYEQIYMPKIEEELNKNAWSGIYVAPTPGTAGLSINSVNGLGTNIAADITSGALTEYATGVFVDNTMVNQIESWCDSLPIPYRDQPGVIRMSNTNMKKYFRDYRANFGFGNGVAGNENNELRVDATNKRIVGMNSMEGSNRILFSPDVTRNLIWGTRAGYPTYFNIRWMQPTPRVINGTAEIYRFYGAEYLDHLFVNDQA